MMMNYKKWPPKDHRWHHLVFKNKINEIKKQIEEKCIKKGKNDLEYIEKENKLSSKLEWIRSIAQKMENENQYLMQKYKELKIQF